MPLKCMKCAGLYWKGIREKKLRFPGFSNSLELLLSQGLDVLDRNVPFRVGRSLQAVE